MYAVMKTGGKQYRVSEGDILHVAKMPLEIGEAVNIEEVLLISDSEDTLVGQPTVEGARVRVTVQSHGRGKKIIVYKHKKNYHKKQGHRQDYTRLHIDKILREGEEYEEPEEEVVLTKEVEEPELSSVEVPTTEATAVDIEKEDISVESTEDVAEAGLSKDETVTEEESLSEVDAPEAVGDESSKKDASTDTDVSESQPAADDDEDNVAKEENKDGA